MFIKKYPLYKLNRSIKRKCSVCTGRGSYFDWNIKEDKDCPTCNGSGTVSIKLVLCTECNEVVAEDELYLVKDNKGQPQKKVCFGCITTVKKQKRKVI